jgi:hypothetical protein
MHDEILIYKVELELLNLRLADTEAERDRIQKQLQVLKSSPTKASTWSRATVAAISILALASLLSTGALHVAQSNVKEHDSSEVSAMHAPETAHIASTEHPSTGGKKPPPRSDRKKSLFATSKQASQLQWGPSLVMTVPGDHVSHPGFDPLLKQQQENLLTLGFDLGKADGFKGVRTRQAFAEFRALYLPDSASQLQDAELAIIIQTYADLARNDAARFGIDHGIVAAIRLSSVRTGVNFSYLMKLAATESNFKPASEASTSSATGMYQFTHDTWLNTLKKHGAKYGLVADYAANIEYTVTQSGNRRPMVRDKVLYQHLLALRKNPRLSAMMAAETVRDNQQRLAYSLNREPTQADLYLTHFLGASAAITFLQSLEQSPDTHAVELFPEAASSNHYIFHPRTCDPRTVDEVYGLIGEKFRTRRYDDLASN